MISVPALLAGVVIALALDNLWKLGVAAYRLVSSKRGSTPTSAPDAPRRPVTSPYTHINMDYLEWAMEHPDDQDAMTYLVDALDGQHRQMAHMARLMKVHEGWMFEEGSVAALDQYLRLSELENERREAENLALRIEAALSKADAPQQ